MAWLSNNPWLFWLGLALVLAAVETLTVDFTFLMLSGGALAGSLTAALGAGFPIQVIAAVVVAGLLLVLVRPVIRRRFMDGETSHGIGAPGLVGRAARVIEPVTEQDGRIKLAGETWTARVGRGGSRIEPGEDVVVVAIQGATAIVAGTSAAQVEPEGPTDR
ncbi:MAG: NfeD family protein [Nostocoides sp.]